MNETTDVERCERETGACVQVHSAERLGPCTPDNCRYAHPADAQADALDAARYRWLKEESAKRPDFYSGDATWMVSRQQGGFGQNFFGDKIDAAIDAQIAAEKESK